MSQCTHIFHILFCFAYWIRDDQGKEMLKKQLGEALRELSELRSNSPTVFNQEKENLRDELQSALNRLAELQLKTDVEREDLQTQLGEALRQLNEITSASSEREELRRQLEELKRFKANEPDGNQVKVKQKN